MLRVLLLAAFLAGCSKQPPLPPGAARQEPTTPNLLVNGDQEQEGLEGWKAETERGDDVPTWAEPDSEDAERRAGTRSARMGPIESKAGESYQSLSQEVEVHSPRLWIDGWVKFQGKKRGADGRCRAGIEVRFRSGDEDLGGYFAAVAPTGAEFPPAEGALTEVLSNDEKSPWVEVSRHTTEDLAAKGLSLAKEPDHVAVRLWLQVEGNAEGRAWFDDLVVKEIK